uniref:Uncharacterized protein n=1 Tax=Oryza brachyantha TaxID=4533 RepID=J3N2K5_ORYBR
MVFQLAICARLSEYSTEFHLKVSRLVKKQYLSANGMFRQISQTYHYRRMILLLDTRVSMNFRHRLYYRPFAKLLEMYASTNTPSFARQSCKQTNSVTLQETSVCRLDPIPLNTETEIRLQASGFRLQRGIVTIVIRL